MMIKTQYNTIVNMDSVFSVSLRCMGGDEYGVYTDTPEGETAIMGTYNGLERAAEVVDEIFRCHQSRYEMPQE